MCLHLISPPRPIVYWLSTVIGLSFFTSGELTLVVDKKEGKLASLKLGDTDVITSGPEFNLWRAPLDNDGVKGSAEQWRAHWKPLGRWSNDGLNKLTKKLVEFKADATKAGIVIKRSTP